MKNAFTLIELLAAILILSALVLIVSPLVVNNLQKAEKSISEDAKRNIVLAAQNWASDNTDKLPETGKEGSVYIPALEEEGYLGDSGEKGCIVISNKDGIYYYSYDNSDKCKQTALVDDSPPIIDALNTTSTTSTITITAMVWNVHIEKIVMPLLRQVAIIKA